MKSQLAITSAHAAPAKPRPELAHIPAYRREAILRKVAFFERVAAEVERTGNTRIVMRRCQEQSRRLRHRPGCAKNSLYQGYYKWLRKDRDAAALTTAVTARGAAEIAQFLPTIVYHGIVNEGLPFSRSFAEMQKHGVPILASCASYLRRARQLGFLELLAQARMNARGRARLEREHASAIRALDLKERRLLAAIEKGRVAR